MLDEKEKLGGMLWDTMIKWHLKGCGGLFPEMIDFACWILPLLWCPGTV